MSPLLDAVVTEYLPLEEYIADFTVVSADLAGDIWKSERAQHFREPGNKSWEAFVAGRWDEALEIAEADLPKLEAYFADLAQRRSRFFRVRAVESPVSEYLRWELHVLRVRAQAGERIRIADPAVTDLTEAKYGTVPELLILGDAAGYVVDYGGDGAPRGAAKFAQPAAIARCRAALQDMYDSSEEFEEFFTREVAPTSEYGDR
ncbi:hypothetical protein GCM10010435_58410 [Winogradskya consettensis]|uniref:DUF6879 domain-containing protein n=1 Tax=Winogradskya consettensis TaxID=113560 RepID=A0A919SAL7_9ACTN|nr:DUF6879 family protein [Actinoplanes consettensis]GIM66902.1 hypothetical protein Aco04nite_03910 [Actinoplanes consettensis]